MHDRTCEAPRCERRRSRRLVGPLAILAILLAGCSSRSGFIRPQDYPLTIRVACVGDSITYGAGLKNRGADSYPAVLGGLLGDRFETRNFGVNGATLLKKGDRSYRLLPQFKQVALFGPDVIVIKLGTNDTKPQNWRFGDDFADDLREMVDHFAALPSRPRIWLCLPVPAYAVQWGINEDTLVGGVIPAIRTVAAEKDLPVIDLHTALSGRPEYFPDKIHPNAEGARIIAQTIRTELIGPQP